MMTRLKYTLLAASLLTLTSQALVAAVEIKLNLSCPTKHGTEEPCPLQKTEHSVIISHGEVAPLFLKKVEATAHGDENVGTINTLPKSSATLYVDGNPCSPIISPDSWTGKSQLFISADMTSAGKVESCKYSFK